MIKDQDYEALCPCLLWLSIEHIKHMLTTTIPSGFAMCITFPFADISSHISVLPPSPIIIRYSTGPVNSVESAEFTPT